MSVINCNNYLGGLISENIGDPIINSFYDSEVSGMSDTGNGEPKTTEELKQQSTFTGWDFETVWNINEGSTYPYLRENTQSPLPQ